MLNPRRMLGEAEPVAQTVPVPPPTRPPGAPGPSRPSSAARGGRFKATPSPTLDSVRSEVSTKSPQSPLSEADSWSPAESEKYESSEPEGQEERIEHVDENGQPRQAWRLLPAQPGAAPPRGWDESGAQDATEAKHLRDRVRDLEEELSNEQDRRAAAEEHLERLRAAQEPLGRAPGSAPGPVSEYARMDAGCQTSSRVVLEEELAERMGALQDDNDALGIENEALLRRLAVLEEEAAQLRADNAVLWGEQSQLQSLRDDRRELERRLHAATTAARAPKPAPGAPRAAASPARARPGGDETPRAAERGEGTPKEAEAPPAAIPEAAGSAARAATVLGAARGDGAMREAAADGCKDESGPAGPAARRAAGDGGAAGRRGGAWDSFLSFGAAGGGAGGGARQGRFELEDADAAAGIRRASPRVSASGRASPRVSPRVGPRAADAPPADAARRAWGPAGTRPASAAAGARARAPGDGGLARRRSGGTHVEALDAGAIGDDIPRGAAAAAARGEEGDRDDARAALEHAGWISAGGAAGAAGAGGAGGAGMKAAEYRQAVGDYRDRIALLNKKYATGK